MTNDQLLNEIKNADLADEVTISRIKRESVVSGESVEAVVSRTRLVDDRKLAELKSSFLKIPYKKVDPESIEKDLLEIIPEESARTYSAIPVEKKDNMLVVGMVYPDDTKAQEALKFIARSNRLNLGVYLISYNDWRNVLRKYSSYRTELEKAVQSLGLREGESERRMANLEESGSAEDAPIIKIVANTIKEAVASRASDVHIEPQGNYLRVRFRVDGDLKEEASLPVELSQPVVSRVKVMSNLKIDETRVPQDGRFRSVVFDKKIDFRVSTFPTPLGEKVAIRILDPSTGLKSFSDLDFSGDTGDVIKNGLGKPFGMILVTGPTGSGKTTTLYAMLQDLNSESVNIVSVEDPVEYFVSGINQSQIRPEIGYDFASGLRQILRQDPDIVMVGEIRDNETAGLAVHAALTGHIVLSTLHTNNSIGVIPRLIDMGVAPFLLPASLNLMIGQRLLGLVCDGCKVEKDVSPQVAKLIKQALSDLPEELGGKHKEPYKTYEGKGCVKCRGRGTFGRGPIFEVLKMTPQLEEIINSGPTIQKIVKEAKNQGMITLREDGVLKALAGKVMIEEVLRETEEL